MIRIFSVFLALFFIFHAASALAQDIDSANEIDWKKGAWGDLSQYIGTYKIDSVLKDERVAAALKSQLGEEKVDVLEDNLFARGPIGFSDDCLLISGNASHSADLNSAFLAVCMYKGEVHTVLKDDGQISLFTAVEKYDYLPQQMKLWVYFQTNPQALQLPESVQLVSPIE